MKSSNFNTNQNNLMLFFGVLALLGNLDIKHVDVIFIVLGFLR